MNYPTKEAAMLRKRVLAKQKRLNSVLQQYNASNLRIFGSVARGDANINSDIDFLVTPNEHMSYFDLAGLSYRIREELNHNIDLVLDSSLKEYVKKGIKDEELIQL